MLEIISAGFQKAKALLTGQTVLSAENIDSAVRSIRQALLEADVELGVVRRFLERVQAAALGEIVDLRVSHAGKKKYASPGDHFVLICQRELEKLMGSTAESPIVYQRPLTSIMLVGLQGTGKTTTCAKLAKWLLAERRRPMLVAADIYRPAAVTQLQVLGQQLQVPVYSRANVAPPQLCVEALQAAKAQKCDVVLFDTAGRLAIDDALMQELEAIKQQTQPHNIFLVCDAMAGQDTVRSATLFHQRLQLSGFILTKLDGDARGGAALSIREVTGQPIKFVGMGESLDKLEKFRPAGLASRILGMGDVVGLMHDFEQVIDEKSATQSAKKMLHGSFTLQDFLAQLRLFKQMGSAKDIFDKLPGVAAAPKAMQPPDDRIFSMTEAMIQSMTPHERQQPSLITGKRLQRIASGSGTPPKDVEQLLERFAMMQKMMRQLRQQPGLLGTLPGMSQFGGLRGSPSKRSAAALGGPPLPSLQPISSLAAAAAAELGPGPPSFAPELRYKHKQKSKGKRKAEKQARKKSRR